MVPKAGCLEDGPRVPQTVSYHMKCILCYVSKHFKTEEMHNKYQNPHIKYSVYMYLVSHCAVLHIPNIVYVYICGMKTRNHLSVQSELRVDLSRHISECVQQYKITKGCRPLNETCEPATFCVLSVL